MFFKKRARCPKIKVNLSNLLKHKYISVCNCEISL